MPAGADPATPPYNRKRYWNLMKMARFSRRNADDCHGRSVMPSPFRSRSMWLAWRKRSS